MNTNLNTSLEFWMLILSAALLVISVYFNAQNYRKRRHKVVGYLTLTWVSLFFINILQGLAYLFMSSPLFIAYNLFWIPFFLFLILSSDSLARYDIDPKKMLFLGIFSCGLIISAFFFENVEIRTHPNGDLTIYSTGLLSFFSTVFSFIQTYFWLHEAFHIYSSAPLSLRKAARYTIIGALMICIFPFFALFSGLHSLLPGSVFLGGSIGALIITINFERYPALTDLLIKISNSTEVKYIQELQKKIRSTEIKYQLLAETVTEIIFEIDTAGKILYSNRAQEDLLGYALTEIQGKDFWLLVGDLESKDKFMKISKTIPQKNIKLRLNTKDSRIKTLLIDTAIKYGDKDTPNGIILLARDISELELKEKALQEQNALLIRSQKMESLGNLTGGIAHDFNNIIQTILGNAELIPIDDETNQEIDTSVKEIVRACEKGMQITRQILSFSRKNIDEFTQINFVEVIENILATIKRLIPKTIQIELTIPQETLFIRGDETQIQQIVMNLVLNARDAMLNGGIIRIELSTASFTKKDAEKYPPLRAGKNLVMKIKDSGMGMDKTAKIHLFEPFFTTKMKGKGTGLGLFIVYNIVQNHNGFVECFSELGKGTEFKIYFPLIDDSKIVEKIEDKPTSFKSLKGTECILVVDDEEPIRRICHHILTEAGYTVLLAENGETGLQIHSVHKAQIKLIILDYIMPKMDGKQFLQALNTQESDLPEIILSTGFSNDESEKDMNGLGVKYILHKPVHAMELLKKVREVLDNIKTKV